MPGEGDEGWQVSAVGVCLSPSAASDHPQHIMLGLIIFIDDLSCYKNICQNYCLSCPNNSDYSIPSINYRQLHSQLFPLSLPSISCIISTDKSFVHTDIGLRGFLVGYFGEGVSPSGFSNYLCNCFPFLQTAVQK